MKKIIAIASILFYSSVLFAQDPMIGEIRIFADNFAPMNWAFCDGTLYSISQYSACYTYIGTTYGGDGQTTFAVPDLRNKLAVGMGQGTGLSNYTIGQQGGSNTVTYGVANLPAHTHTVTINASQNTSDKDTPVGNYPGITSGNTYSTTSNANMGISSLSIGNLSNAGGSQSQNNMQPYTGINYIICMEGLYGSTSGESFLGEVKLTASSQVPNNWVPCNGQILQINQYQALYSLLGTTYGGNGTTNFALPDLRGRVPISRGTSTTGSFYTLGQIGGTEGETLTIAQMAAHAHMGSATLGVYSGIGNSNTPEGNYPAINPQRGNEFSSTATSTSALSIGVTDAAGAGVPIDNRQSYNTIQYIICISGIFPSRN